MAQNRPARDAKRRARAPKSSATSAAAAGGDHAPQAQRASTESHGLHDLQAIADLARVVRDFDIAELELELGGNKLRLRRGAATTANGHVEPEQALVPRVVVPPAHIAAIPAVAPQSAPPAPPPAAAAVAIAPVEEDAIMVTSPFVGTFYRAPSPDAPSFVEVGTVVKKGQPLCIIEAMKLMNEIEADHDGKVLAILAQNGAPVEYGEALFKLGRV